MTVTPSGLPAWSRTASHTQYGGNVDKRDYMGVGPVDALTDVSAAQFCRATADLAAAVRTLPMCVMTLLCNDTSSAAPTIEFVNMMSSVPRTTSYAGDSAPAGFPSAARNNNGDITVTFDSSYTDEYDVEEDFAPTQANTTVHATAHRVATVAISGQTVRVRVYDATGAAVSDPRVTLAVW
jgi:hypothetical protein